MQGSSQAGRQAGRVRAHTHTYTHTHTHTHTHTQVLPSLHLLSPFNCANGVWGTVLALLVVQVVIVN
jgi:hypothetical protein